MGYVHVYTGNGKGKSSAAFGMALRALGAGKRVFIGQFVKSIKYHETDLENRYPDVAIKQFGTRCFIDSTPNDIDAQAAVRGWEESVKIMKSGEYDLVILDELTIAIYFKLLTVEAVIAGLLERAASVEVIITGRYAPAELFEMADLVTDMQEVKHYYTQGVVSRDGFDR